MVPPPIHKMKFILSLSAMAKAAMKRRTVAEIDAEIERCKAATLVLIEKFRANEEQARLREQVIQEEMEQPDYTEADLAGHMSQLYNIMDRFRTSHKRIRDLQKYIASLEADKAALIAAANENNGEVI